MNVLSRKVRDAENKSSPFTISPVCENNLKVNYNFDIIFLVITTRRHSSLAREVEIKPNPTFLAFLCLLVGVYMSQFFGDALFGSAKEVSSVHRCPIQKVNSVIRYEKKKKKARE